MEEILGLADAKDTKKICFRSKARIVSGNNRTRYEGSGLPRARKDSGKKRNSRL